VKYPGCDPQKAYMLIFPGFVLPVFGQEIGHRGGDRIPVFPMKVPGHRPLLARVIPNTARLFCIFQLERQVSDHALQFLPK